MCMSSPLLARGLAFSRGSVPFRCQTHGGLQPPSAAPEGNLSSTGCSSVFVRGCLTIPSAGVTAPCVLMNEDTPYVAAFARRPAKSVLETSKLPQELPNKGLLGRCFCRRLVIISLAEGPSHPRP